jgi:hypothetical protein
MFRFHTLFWPDWVYLSLEVSLSLSYTFFLSITPKVPMQVESYPLSSKQTEDITDQFRLICQGQQRSAGWEADRCADDLCMQLDVYLKRACSYQPPPTPPPAFSEIRLSFSDRKHVIDYIQQQKETKPSFSVIDVGGVYGGWSFSVLTAMVDRNSMDSVQLDNITRFDANINFESGWVKILEHVEKHGKFDFVICSHTLEDLALPQVTLNMLPKVAHEGFVAVPSKYRELINGVEGIWQGYNHHRWICTFRDGIFKLYPKLG